jgi:hypothetical protein
MAQEKVSSVTFEQFRVQMDDVIFKIDKMIAGNRTGIQVFADRMLELWAMANYHELDDRLENTHYTPRSLVYKTVEEKLVKAKEQWRVVQKSIESKYDNDYYSDCTDQLAYIIDGAIKSHPSKKKFIRERVVFRRFASLRNKYLGGKARL